MIGIDRIYEDWERITCQRIPRSMVFVGSDIRYAFYRHGSAFYHNSHAIQVDGNVEYPDSGTQTCNCCKSGEVSN